VSSTNLFVGTFPGEYVRESTDAGYRLRQMSANAANVLRQLLQRRRELNFVTFQNDLDPE